MYQKFSHIYSHIYQALFKSWLCRGKSWSLMARNFSVDGETDMRQIGSTVMCGLIQWQRCYQGLAEEISESFHGGGHVSRSDEKKFFHKMLWLCQWPFGELSLQSDWVASSKKLMQPWAVVFTYWVSALMITESKKMENGYGNGEGWPRQKKERGLMDECIENDFVEG